MKAILSLFSDYFEYVIAAILVAIVGVCLKVTYDNGMQNGISKTMVAWQAQELKRSKEIDNYKEEIDKLERENILNTERHRNETIAANKTHTAELNRLELDYAKRLRDSTKRSAVYKRMSEAGESERTRLAEHATKLDQSLEEGRALEREYRSAVRQRDELITILISQIKSIQSTINSLGTKDERKDSSTGK